MMELYKLFRRESKRKKRVRKPENMPCANACAYYLLRMYGIREQSGARLFWTAQIGTVLLRNGLKCVVKCFDSALYNDCVNGCCTDENAVHALDEFVQTGGTVVEERLGGEFPPVDKPVICCVSSALWNCDRRMNGGHFVTVLPVRKSGRVLVINPLKAEFSAEWVSLPFLKYCMRAFGSWRIEPDISVREHKEKKWTLKC